MENNTVKIDLETYESMKNEIKELRKQVKEKNYIQRIFTFSLGIRSSFYVYYHYAPINFLHKRIMRNTLTSIAEHSDWLETTEYWYNKRWLLHRKRVEFGKQPLAIWQFVACKLVNGVWVVLEYPDADYYMMVTEQTLKEYQEAKSRCIFGGFVYDSKMEYWHNNNISFDEEYIENKTIEDIVKYNLELTASAIKEFGL